MAAILPQNKIKEAQAWLHDIFVWGGSLKNPQRKVPTDQYRYMYGTHPDNFRVNEQKYQEAAKIICACIRSRKVETQRFLAFDKAIKALAPCHFLPGLDELRGSVGEPAEVLCTFIAWFCSANNLVYDNRNASVEEMKQIKNTLIGATLWDNYLFAVGHTPANNPGGGTVASTGGASANPDPTPAPANPATNNGNGAGTVTQTTVKSGGPAGHTLYRKNASGILGNGKVTKISTDGYVYWITGKFVATGGKTDPKLHVKPYYAKAPLKVNYGSGQGYNDCILYFCSKQQAENFMGIADAAKPNTVASLMVKAIGEDKNGYVEVATEFGNAYIKASKLHEDVEENLEENNENTENKYPVSNRAVAEAMKDDCFFRD